MIKNYPKISLRYLVRHKEYTVINILGLAVSITCCILIMLFVRSELSYDAFHSKADRLYRVWQREKYDGKTSDDVVTPLPLADAIKSSFPEAEAVSRVVWINPIVKVGQSSFTEEGMPLAILFRNELMKHPQVLNASVSAFSFIETPWIQLGYSDEKKQYKSLQYNAVDPYFIPSLGIHVIEGRNFSTINSTDRSGTVIINEAYVKAFNLTDPIGKKLSGPFPQQIVDVVKDFNFESLHTKIQPLVMSCNADSLMKYSNDVMFSAPPQPRISILLKAGNLSDNISLLKQTWAAIAPGQDFDYKFLDDAIAAQYQQEQRTNMIVQIASGLSIFIACMGLFGLATLAVVKRVKEIGIRKVLGANVSSIVKLLSVDFVKLVLIAAVIASPVAWWAMNKWLQDFNYRVDINSWVFILAGLAATLIALATVSYHAIKAALVNPVKSLKSE